MTATKRFAAILLCFLLLVSFASCASVPEVVGRWEITIEDEELGSVLMVYHFTEEGEINLEQRDGDQIPFSIPFGTFVVDGDEITVFSDGKSSVYTFSVTNDTLIFSSEGEEDLVFHRV